MEKILEQCIMKYKSKKLMQYKLLDRQKRHFKRKRKLRRKKLPGSGEVFSQKSSVVNDYQTEDECPGDSEESDSDTEEARENNNNKAEAAVSVRRQCAKTRTTLAENQLENNERGELVCLTCLKQFSNVQNLRRHLRLHLQRDSNIAELDSDGCDQADKAGEEKKFQCDFCPEKFHNKSAFQIHEKTHNSQELVCFMCEKKYLDRYSLRYHLRTHGIGLQIRCELCGKNFTKQSRLQAHINSIHKNIRNFQCQHCDKAFKAKIHLDNHMLQHSGDRPFECGQCGERFRHKLSLISHARIHSDSRPFVCDTCGKAFRDNSTLKAHTRVHSGEKPYKCNLCDKSFTQRAGLNYHKAVHAGEKPHKCGQCDYATAKKASLSYHVKTMHKAGDKKPEEIKTDKSVVMVSCTEARACPAMLSPPAQQGDALFAGSHNSHEQNKYEESGLSNSLPSFNILKSYDSSSLQEAIVCEPRTGPGSEAINEDRFSPYESHSDPSLSPPLTPPIQEFQVGLSQPFVILISD